MKQISILIVDDHQIVLEALERTLNSFDDFRVIHYSGEIKGVLSFIQEKKPIVILMDINMQPVSGFQLAEEILKDNPRQKIIAVSATVLPAYAKKFLRLGGKGYVSKSSPLTELEDAIRSVAEGVNYLSKDIRQLMAEFEDISRQIENKPELSVRELEIVGMVGEGLSSKEIAGQLGISLKTVEAHRHHIMKKTGFKNTAALLKFINKTGL